MRALAAGTAALTIAATPAAAQNVGHFVPRTSYVAGNLVAAKMGQCLLKRDRRRAVAAVDLAPGSDAYRTLAREIEQSVTACLNGARSASISSFYLRGATSEALLRENDGALLQAAAAVTPIAPQRVTLSDADKVAPAAIACAVRADPTDAGAMIAADAATPAEMAAFNKLVPSLQACVPATGAVTLRRPTVRPGVAIALYQLGRGTAASRSSNGAN